MIISHILSFRLCLNYWGVDGECIYCEVTYYIFNIICPYRYLLRWPWFHQSLHQWSIDNTRTDYLCSYLHGSFRLTSFFCCFHGTPVLTEITQLFLYHDGFVVKLCEVVWISFYLEPFVPHVSYCLSKSWYETRA